MADGGARRRRPTAAAERARRAAVVALAAVLAACFLSGVRADGVAPKVVGGQRAPQQRFTHQVGVYIRMGEGDFICGGSLVAPNVVVTAAHCVWDPSFNSVVYHTDLWVIVGAYEAFDLPGQGGGTRINVNYVLMHPQFYYPKSDTESPFNDIAVLVLSSSAVLGPTVGTIPIASASEIMASRYSNWVVSGWGALNNRKHSPLPLYLQYGLVRLVDPTHPYCASQFPMWLRFSLLCAGTLRAVSAGASVQDSCYGDSGGPLALNVANLDDPAAAPQSGDRLVGIVSGGALKCGQKKTPGLYTLAYNYKAWVDCIIGSSGSPFGCDATPGNATWHYEDSSHDTAWAGAPDATLKLPRAPPAGGPMAWCQAQCEARALKRPTTPAGCAALTLGAPPPARPGGAPGQACYLFTSPPARLCGVGEAGGACAAQVQGSKRVVFG